MGKKSKTNGSPAGAGGGTQDSPFAVLAALSGLPTELPVANVAPEIPGTREPARTKTRVRLVLRRETKHRGGKAVIIVAGLGAPAGFDLHDTEELARQLKHQLGCGGTVEEHGEDREIVLQGDQAGKVAELLRARGFRVDGVTS
ncbi:MAG: translation initiation factor [Deltaproteobacteria bacterium HGW-Deltaproteobacteria-22]|jgi:translation initiation factor 1 (eIF-1/SUI1)|nr:MAG: translation initiation factor [Deltaproteobacteria bacterium HGW-Deltaproteobacteria-22]